MKPQNIRGQRKKTVHKLRKRLYEIHKLERDLGYYELEKPIRHGWVKELVLTPNIETFKNNKAVKEVYQILERQFWGITKEKADKKWKSQQSEYLLHKDVLTINKRQYRKLSESAKKLCVPFRYKNKDRKWKLRFYVNIPQSVSDIKYRRYYITHRCKIDPKLKSEKDLIYQQFEKNGWYEANLKMWKYKDEWTQGKVINILDREKNIKKELRSFRGSQYQDFSID